MSAQPARPSKKPRHPAIYSKVETIKSQIDKLVAKMQREPSFLPTRDQVEKYAIEINAVIVRNRDTIRQFESFLKAAIIDLTEVPEMHAQMQQISFLTALKDASQKIQLFLDCC